MKNKKSIVIGSILKPLLEEFVRKFSLIASGGGFRALDVLI